MRLFVAVQIPDPAAKLLEAVQAELKTRMSGVRWVAPGHMHITLKFLGTVTEERLSSLDASLAEAATASPVFKLRPAGLGAFPSLEHPHVLWAGIGEGAPALTALARRVERSAGRAGFLKEDREYRPHITLGRAERARFTGSDAWPSTWTRKEFDPFTVDAVVLMESVLHSKGAVYKVLRGYRLGRSC